MEDDGSDVVRVLEAYKRVWSDTIKVFQLQNRVTGVEVAVGATVGLGFLVAVAVGIGTVGVLVGRGVLVTVGVASRAVMIRKV